MRDEWRHAAVDGVTGQAIGDAGGAMLGPYDARNAKWENIGRL
jgi:hypothetical protein